MTKSPEWDQCKEQLLEAIAHAASVIEEVVNQSHNIGEADLAAKAHCAMGLLLYTLREYE